MNQKTIERAWAENVTAAIVFILLFLPEISKCIALQLPY
jgi:hypothetical protein